MPFVPLCWRAALPSSSVGWQRSAPLGITIPIAPQQARPPCWRVRGNRVYSFRTVLGSGDHFSRVYRFSARMPAAGIEASAAARKVSTLSHCTKMELEHHVCRPMPRGHSFVIWLDLFLRLFSGAKAIWLSIVEQSGVSRLDPGPTRTKPWQRHHAPHRCQPYPLPRGPGRPGVCAEAAPAGS